MALGDDRAMMPREGCLCQFISLLRQNQSPKLTHTFLHVASYLFDARHTPLVRRPGADFPSRQTFEPQIFCHVRSDEELS